MQLEMDDERHSRPADLKYFAAKFFGPGSQSRFRRWD